MIGVILAAAGSGARFGSDTPKQFLEFQEKPLYLHALQRFLTFSSQIVLVVPAGWMDQVQEQIRQASLEAKVLLQPGAGHRQDSVYRGLQRLAEEIRITLVHDAVRPFVSTELISRVIEATRIHQACVPALPVRETVKEIHNDIVVRTLEREGLRLVQTPQGFGTNLLKTAFEQAIKEGFYGADESILVERLGHSVHVVAGDPANIKITWKEDLEGIKS